MSELSKQALKVENNQSFPNNNAGLITPSNLRTFNEDMIDSTVNQATYTADSASFDSRINAITGSATNTGSLLTTASFDNGTRNLTFTKGDSSTFAVNIPDVSGSALPSGVVSGSSQLTGSFVTLDTIQTITGRKLFSPSPDGSVGIALQSATRLTFGSVGTNRISSPDSNTLNIETINSSPVSGSPNTLNIISGVNGQTGGNGSIINIQTKGVQQDQRVAISSSLVSISGNTSLSGSLNVSSSLTARGLRYPLADNGAKSFIQTDGAGNLSLEYVDAVFETVRNMSGVALQKGTPVYISGSTGDNGNAYVADASNASTMPAIYILGEDLNAGDTGIALVSGLIEGVNTSAFTAGTEIYVAEGGGYTSTRPSGSNSVVQKLGVVTKQGVGGQGVIINQLEAELPNIQTGYAWVGNGGNQPVAVPTSSFGGGGTGNGFPFSGSAVITGSLSVSETIKSQVYMNPQTLDGFVIPTNNNAMLVGPVAISGSVVVEGNSNLLVLSQITGSGGSTTLPSGVVSGSSQLTASYDLRYALSGSGGGTLATGSFATTGSNTFIGNQTITGSLLVSSSDVITIIAPSFGGAPAPGGVSVTGSMSVNGNFAIQGGNFVVNQVNTSKVVGETASTLDIVSNVRIYNDANINNPRSLGVSGSAFVSQSLFVGGNSNFTGNQEITGSLSVSSSTDRIVLNGPNFSTFSPGNIGGTYVVNSFTVGGDTRLEGAVRFAQADMQKLVGTTTGDLPGGGNQLSLITNVKMFDDSNVANPRWFALSGSADVSQSLYVGEALRLKPSNPLPSGTTGSLAVSGSNLYFFDGTWRQVSLI